MVLTSTEVLLHKILSAIRLRAVAQNQQCELHDRLKLEAVEAILAAKKVRWSKDISLYEDSEMCTDQRLKIDAFISHLLAGHDGKPCPRGERPIVGSRANAHMALPAMKVSTTQHTSNKN